jgi:beta-phosphoglucomutase
VKELILHFNDFDAVIFDMDGTMIDNMFYHKRAWMEFTGRHGIYPSEKEFKQKFSGLKNDKILEGIFNKKLTEQEVTSHAEKKEQLYRDLYAPHIQEVKGLTDILNTLKTHNKKVAVATTAPKKNRDFGLEALRMTDTFSVVLGEEDVIHSKPDPGIYLEAAKRLGVEPGRCLVFEDSPPGVTAGKAAGMKVIGILTTHSEEDLKDADYQIRDFTAISFQ